MEEEYQPLCNTDHDTDEFLVFDRIDKRYIFDTTYHTLATKRIKEEIQKRGSAVQIVFTKPVDMSYKIKHGLNLTKDLLSMWGHCELWFGKKVARMVVGHYGTYMIPLTLCCDEFDIVTLPFVDTIKAFDIAKAICKQDMLYRIGYNIRLLTVCYHILTRLLGVETDENSNKDDYNPSDPSSWTKGVFCSQVVLLFLKECVNQNAIAIPDPAKHSRFMGVYSKTCLPSDLKSLIKETWGSS